MSPRARTQRLAAHGSVPRAARVQSPASRIVVVSLYSESRGPAVVNRNIPCIACTVSYMAPGHLARLITLSL